jgi:hypothetical protein
MAIVVVEMLVVVKIIKLIRNCWQLVILKRSLYPVVVLFRGLAVGDCYMLCYNMLPLMMATMGPKHM